jgi:hypothetical protein
MKCLICSGKTPRGAKLCLACRSALRRARDDTVCELLPLPRRLDVFAYSHAPTVTGAPPRVSRAVKEKKARVTDAKRTPAPARSLPFDKLQLAALAVAVLVLALLGGMLLRQSHDTHADLRELRPPATHDNGPRISPASIAAEARHSVALAEPPMLADASTPVESAVPDPVRKDRPKTDRPRPRIANPAPVAVADSSFRLPVEEVVGPIPAIKPEIASAPIPDRWQLLSGRLTGCAGANLFARVACEHAARAQYCEGYWGQVAQCPAGITNEHGQ